MTQDLTDRPLDHYDKCILVIGNLNDGFTFVGPFDSFDDADEYARNVNSMTWVATLDQP